MVVRRSGIRPWESSKTFQWGCAHPSSKGRCQTNVRRKSTSFFLTKLCGVLVFGSAPPGRFRLRVLRPIQLVTHTILSYTTSSHIIFVTHTILLHTILSHIQLCHTHTHNFVTHTHNFVTHNFVTYNFIEHNFVTHTHNFVTHTQL